MLRAPRQERPSTIRATMSLSEPNARDFAALLRRTGVPLSLRERRHAYQAGLYLFKMIATVDAPSDDALAPAGHFDAGEAW